MLNPNKAYTFKNIPQKTLKESRECYLDIEKLFNKISSNKEFPDELKTCGYWIKNTGVKKIDPNNSKSYRTESVLPVVS